MSDTTITPTNSDPQDLINAALGTTTPTTPATPMTEPQPTLPMPEPAAMPSELTEAPVLPPIQPIAPTIAQQPSAPIVMGDDTPLAFVGSSPNSTTPTTEPVTEPTMPVSLGTSAPMDAVPTVPPVLTPSEKPVQKKSRAKTILVGLALAIALVGGIGIFGYQQYGSVGALIAGVLSEGKDCPKGKHVNDSGQCVTNDIKGGGEEKVPPEKGGSPDNCGDGYAWCGVGISKCVSFDALAAAGGGCNKYGEKVYGIPTVYGATPGRLAPDMSCDPAKIANKTMKQCTCGSSNYCFDRDGSCSSTPITRLDGSTVDTGFCGLVGSIPAGSTTFKEYDGLFNADGTLKYNYFCDLTGCNTSDTSCQVVRYTCNSTVSGNSCTDQSSAYVKNSMTTSNSLKFTGACGKVEQIDVSCGGYKTSRTSINPPCEKAEDTPNPSPSPSVPVVAPKLMCDGLTRTPTTTPVIGDKLTFTCTGSSVPAGSVSLTYKFRSAIDGGVWSSMTNKTATTAEMMINACGTYKVQCQACGTISGAVVCDPAWTGASAL